MHLLLALLLSQVMEPTSPEGPIFSSPSRLGNLALLEFAPASGAGMGVACACAAVTGAKAEALTYSRASAAECYSNDGQTLTQCSTNQPVVSSGTAASSVLGLWTEQSRDNEAVWCRDLSNAAWTKTSMACAKTATGMRNDANGASTCTASGANGTVLQVLVSAAVTRTTSLHVKRRTGTGVVEVTRDNGTTWSAITASLSSTLWRRVVPRETPGCAGGNCIVVAAMTGSVVNPTFGLRLGTSGDAVDVDFVQDEPGDEATSPIATTTTWVNRARVIADLPVAMSPTGAAGFSVSASQVSSNGVYTAGGTAIPIVLGNGALGSDSPATYLWMYTSTAGGRHAIDTGGVVSAGATAINQMFVDFDETETSLAAVHTGTALISCQRGVCATGVGSTLGTPAFTRVLLGRYGAAVNGQSNAVITRVCVDPSSRCAPTPADGPIVWDGDSIVFGNGSMPLTPAVRLAALSGRGVRNLGVGSSTIASCSSRWNAVAAAGYQTLVWSCAVNDLAAGTAGAAAATAAQLSLADARARGLKVVITQVTPWKNSPGWTSGKQTETAAYNASMSAWAGSNGATYVSTASMGGEGADPDLMLAAYDSGDHIHPTVAGALQLATLVNAAAP